MNLWRWTAGRQHGMVAAQDDHEARVLVCLLIGSRDRIYLVRRKAGEAMPAQPCVTTIARTGVAA